MEVVQACRALSGQGFQAAERWDPRRRYTLTFDPTRIGFDIAHLDSSVALPLFTKQSAIAAIDAADRSLAASAGRM